MAEFQFDTSGEVPICEWSGTHWSDLSPFVQGYIEALFQSMEAQHLPGRAGVLQSAARVGFSVLAPETLARIMEDCERRLRHHPSEGQSGFLRPEPRDLKLNGQRFWRWRHHGLCKNFPPLTLSLNDAGKVYLRYA